MSDNLSLQKRDIINGSKSFSAASFFFSKEQKEAAWKLYSWCRYCDDQIDNYPILIAQSNLEKLKIDLTNITSQNFQADYQTQGLKEVIYKFKIPTKYPADLLTGMEMDINNRRYHTLSELEEYCYAVAGVVGLMMCHIMGIESDKALKHAVALGNAMQLTNICRDIKEDFYKVRIYLPLEMLKKAKIPLDDILNPAYRAQMISIQESLLQRADELYKEGYEGLKYLAPRSALAVLIAGKIYSHISTLIRKNPNNSFEARVYVPKPQKVLLALSAIIQLSHQQIRSKFKKAIAYSTWKNWGKNEN